MSNKNNIGLFQAGPYVIGNGLSGGYTFKLQFVVDVVRKTVHGAGNITQATNPPVNVATNINGEYSPLLGTYQILVNAEGFNPFIPIVPQQKNVTLQLFLDKDWKSGVANYSFYNGKEWIRLRNQKVELVAPENLEQLASAVAAQEEELEPVN
ncbi:DUF1842 domain-containing protein [Tenacibaculum xiamenense]|uniref:DUF1842 domain-containing protein n=1 Tax=Tenacibaculum xiamenense TaxID=1261553 RepID=UPI003894F931